MTTCPCSARKANFSAKKSPSLGGWVKATSEGVQPLIDHLKEEQLRSAIIAKDFTPDQRHALREEKSVPILDSMAEWIEKNRFTVPPKGLMGKAFTYAHNQWEALRRYTEDGRLEIDNGRSERMMRLIAVGRKNWLFAGNDDGGRRAANHYTLIGN